MYQTIIGLEIHTESKTKTKMFCGCLNNPNEKEPNTNICPVCMGHPGTLPVINNEAIEKIIKAGLALNCSIREHSKFDRKNYFYPDLTKGYQISQFDKPFCQNGYLEVETEEGRKRIRINRIHMEEDTGKLTHPKTKSYSLVDFNRVGVPLMELVTEPDISSGKEARAFCEELQLIFRYLDVSDADMEKGQMRCEVNISLKKEEDLKLGTKVEIKNLNSFRSVEKAVDYEIKRQSKMIDQGKEVVQETRGWDDEKQKTVSQRKKEDAHEYRYFPDPDLCMVRISKEKKEEIHSQIPELPQQKRDRFGSEYGLDLKSIENFIKNRELSKYFEEIMSELRNWIKEVDGKKGVDRNEFLSLSKICFNFLTTDFLGMIRNKKIDKKLEETISQENFAEFVMLSYKKKISSKIAKMVLEKMIGTDKDPEHIIEESGLSQISDEKELEKIVKEVLDKNPKAVDDLKAGKENALKFLMGQVMAASRGKADPGKAEKVIRSLI